MGRYNHTNQPARASVWFGRRGLGSAAAGESRMQIHWDAAVAGAHVFQ